jgi:hypothetical protein
VARDGTSTTTPDGDGIAKPKINRYTPHCSEPPIFQSFQTCFSMRG